MSVNRKENYMATEQIVSLDTLGSGAAMEMFQDELQRVLDNITDVNTDPKAVREVKLTVKIKPDEGREVGAVTISTASKVAPIKSVGTVFFIGKRAGQTVAMERNPKQLTFDDANVVSMKEAK